MLSLTPMPKTLIALIAALLGSPAWPDTLISNVNGIQVDEQSRLQHFTGLLIGDDGKVVRVLRANQAQPRAASIIDAHGRTLLPGLIDAHGHVMGLGFGAMQLDLV